MSSSPAADAPRPALRQGVLVVCAVAALFTAISTSLESQRSVARMAASSPTAFAATATGTDASAAESCSAR